MHNVGADAITSREIPVLVPVCDACNGNWMAELESEVSRFFKPMIRGERTALTPDEQALLARWAVKTVLMIEYTMGKRWQRLPRDLTSWVYAGRLNEIPPPSTEVFLGRLTPSTILIDLVYYVQFDPAPEAVWPPGPVHYDHVAYRAVLTVGAVVIEITGTDVERAVRIPWRGQMHEALVPIWPTAGEVFWPTAVALNEAGRDDFARPALTIDFNRTANGIEAVARRYPDDATTRVYARFGMESAATPKKSKP